MTHGRRTSWAIDVLVGIILSMTAILGQAAEPQVPAGFTVEKVAGYPRLHRPIFASFDEAGRLYVGESSGDNLNRAQMLEKKPHWITRLSDINGDGKFDHATKFVDGITLPQGSLFYRGSLYAVCPPSVWKFTDTDDDGVADQREELLTGFGFNGNACDTHGPFLSPAGRLYIVQGRHGHEFKDRDGQVYSQGKAGRIYSCLPDGSDVRVHAGGGFDNPVEVDFTEEGECLGTVNILYRDRGDCLMHWVEGGVYPRDDLGDMVAEFPWTGGLLGPVHNLGHVAVSGIMRYRGAHFGADYRDRWFFTEFNTHKVRTATLSRTGSTFAAEVQEFLTSDDTDFHPTDVLEDADGSLLVVDTGGWFLNGCPTSRVAKPEIYGGLYRIRKTAGIAVEDGRNINYGNAGAWIFPPTHYLSRENPRPAVREAWTELWTEYFRRLERPNTPPASSVWGYYWPVVAKHAPAAREKSEAEVAAFKDEFERQIAASRSEGKFPPLDPSEVIGLIRAWGRSSLASPVTLVDGAPKVLAMAETSQRIATLTTLADLAWAAPLTEADALAFIGWAETATLPELRALAQLAAMRCVDRVTPVFPWTDVTLAKFVALAARADLDRTAEHALVVALQRAPAAEPLLSALKHESSSVRRVAVIALSERDPAFLTFEHVLPLLSAEDAMLQRTALEVIGRRSGWAAETLSLLKGWFAESELPADRATAIRGFLVAQLHDPAVQGFITTVLSEPQLPHDRRVLIWEILQRSTIAAWPEDWNPLVVAALQSPADDITLPALRVVTQRNLESYVFGDELLRLAGDRERSLTVRAEAVAGLGARGKQLPAAVFGDVIEYLADPNASSTDVGLAARALGNAKLDGTQLSRLAPYLKTAGPLALSSLIKAYGQSKDPTIGYLFLTSIMQNQAAGALSGDELAAVLRKYPAETQEFAAPLLKGLGADPAAQAARLEELSPLLASGNPDSGKAVFFGKKAACGSCHAVGSEGGRVGPHLTTIGASRSPRDLLEAIVYPSASFVNGYRTTIVVTEDGKVHQGILSAESVEAITLRTQDLQEIRIRRDMIEEQRDGSTSIMPKGLDTQLTPQELRDLLAYLQSRK